MTPLVEWPAWAVLLIAYVFLQRIAELAIAQRNTRRLIKEGAHEFGRRGYPLFIALHSAWLISIVIFAVPNSQPNILLLVLFALTQALRYWALFTLGRYWTTRLISSPSFPRIRKGPYRFFPHPNYLVVVAEIILVPLLLNEKTVAIVFTVLNAALLLWRIRMENRVLRHRENG